MEYHIDTGYRLHQSLGYRLTMAARKMEQLFDEKLRTLRLTRTSWCILLAVGNEQLRRPSDIAEFVGIDRTAASRALSGMETDGLIERSSGSGDRRTTSVHLTKTGAELLVLATPLAIENSRRIEALLHADEFRELGRLLDKLVAEDSKPLSSI